MRTVRQRNRYDFHRQSLVTKDLESNCGFHIPFWMGLLSVLTSGW